MRLDGRRLSRRYRRRSVFGARVVSLGCPIRTGEHLGHKNRRDGLDELWRGLICRRRGRSNVAVTLGPDLRLRQLDITGWEISVRWRKSCDDAREFRHSRGVRRTCGSGTYRVLHISTDVPAGPQNIHLSWILRRQQVWSAPACHGRKREGSRFGRHVRTCGLHLCGRYRNCRNI